MYEANIHFWISQDIIGYLVITIYALIGLMIARKIFRRQRSPNEDQWVESIAGGILWPPVLIGYLLCFLISYRNGDK